MRRVINMVMVFWRGELRALGKNQAMKIMLAKANMGEPGSEKRDRTGAVGAGAILEKETGDITHH